MNHTITGTIYDNAITLSNFAKNNISTNTIKISPPHQNQYYTTTITPHHTAKANFTCFAIDNYGYNYGGNTASNSTLSELDQYNDTLNIWNLKSSVYSKNTSSAFATENFNYICGGGGLGITSTSETLQYNHLNDTWLKKTNNLFARNYATPFSIQNLGYLAGGGESGVAQSTTSQYNEATANWTIKSDLSGVLQAKPGFTLNESGYVLLSNTGCKYNFKIDYWTTSSQAYEQYNYSSFFPLINTGYITHGSYGSVTGSSRQFLPLLDFVIVTGYNGTSRTYTAGFSLNQNGYSCGGSNGTYYCTYYSEVQKYCNYIPRQTLASIKKTTKKPKYLFITTNRIAMPLQIQTDNVNWHNITSNKILTLNYTANTNQFFDYKIKLPSFNNNSYNYATIVLYSSWTQNNGLSFENNDEAFTIKKDEFRIYRYDFVLRTEEATVTTIPSYDTSYANAFVLNQYNYITIHVDGLYNLLQFNASDWTITAKAEYYSRTAGCFTIDNFGYLASNITQTSYNNTIKYNYATDFFTNLNDCSFQIQQSATFEINQYGYIVDGYDNNGANSSIFKYNNILDNYTLINSGVNAEAARAFKLNNRAYIYELNYLKSYNESINIFTTVALLPSNSSCSNNDKYGHIYQGTDYYGILQYTNSDYVPDITISLATS